MFPARHKEGSGQETFPGPTLDEPLFEGTFVQRRCPLLHSRREIELFGNALGFVETDFQATTYSRAGLLGRFSRVFTHFETHLPLKTLTRAAFKGR
ncbi:hypothetical protein AKJ66_03765 [candidate division MSBL1 archaeon SCGC-AAA259E22]|uniref:Uncharacterized protein n=1 Tax=candidate division MSBL1 archaeon SCGC-AAA259E22 TaxID=1698265 RepID=A0A133UER9_9EURY|nr:hypothetical protein AKJ66_03765 [candidate division MSBL1 archaeon SCGC-AAA259E22]